MFKKLLLLSLLVFGSVLGHTQAVQTPTLQGTYNWSGYDTFIFGHLGFSTTPTQCSANTVMNGFTSTFAPNCVTATPAYNQGVENFVGSGGISSSASTLTFLNSTAGYPTTGCGAIDSELICYAGLSNDGLTVTGLTRGLNGSTAASHGANAVWNPYVVAFSGAHVLPNVIIYGGSSGQPDTVNINRPFIENGDNTVSLAINQGGNTVVVTQSGFIQQANVGSCCDDLSELTIGTPSQYQRSQDFITNTFNVMQITNQYQTQQLLGLGGGVAGDVVFSKPATIAAPILQDGNPAGDVAYTYLCQDHAGLVPGTPATSMDQSTTPFPIGVVCPRQAGVALYDILRTAGGYNTGIIASGVLPGTGIFDEPNSTPATGGSIISENTATASISGLDFLKAGDLYDNNLTISTLPLCVGTGNKLTNVGCTGGSSITLSCSSGVECTLVDSVWDVTATGEAGSGEVATGIAAQVGGYSNTGTTIGGASNMYFLNPGLSLAQMTGLFSRFGGNTITSYSIASNVVTFQSNNAYNAGDVIDLINFPTATFFNNNLVTVISSGLSNTQFKVDFTHADVSSTNEIGYSSINIPGQTPTSLGLVIIPPGLFDSPSNAFVNTSFVGPSAQVLDWRKGYAWQQASMYGVKCDAITLNVTLTEGEDTVEVGASLDSTSVGRKVVVGQQNGYGNTGTQNTWVATITGFSFPNITLSANAPFAFSGPAIIGTNNQAALQRAFNDIGTGIPLWLPQCSMLTDTIRWAGSSILGQSMAPTRLISYPGKDLFQQQDGLPITAWSINTSTGVTTFTISAYSAHSILPASAYPAGTNLNGDSVTLASFPTSTFFNSQTVNIATQPTPTTFTVNSVFGQSSSASATEAGVAEPTSSVGAFGSRIENVTFDVNNAIDPSFTWNSYNESATETVEPPMYRPLQTNNQPANDPLAPGWGTNTHNGVATIVQNTAVICVPTALAILPTVGHTLVFPYQTGGMFVATVSSTAGSCTTGKTPFTLSASFPNTSGYSAAQAEWFDTTAPQTLAVAIPGTITLPYTTTLALPFPPIPGWPSNVAGHGHIIIGTQEWDYQGDNFGGTAGGSPTITLRNGPTTVNGGSGYAIGSVVFPLNPCQAMYHQPWPVVPNINGATSATPVNAIYYAGICGGNAAMAMPSADAYAWAPRFGLGGGLNNAHFIDVYGTVTQSNSYGLQNNNGSMLMYEAANFTGYDNTFDDWRVNGLWGVLMQGPAAVNQWGMTYYNIGPTSTGQSIRNCSFHSAYGLTLISMAQSNLDRCDNYSTEVSQFDGLATGSTTTLFIGRTYNEQTGSPVTSIYQWTGKDYNSEPESGDGEEFPPSVIADCDGCTWLGNIFEGGFNIFEGSFQQFHGTQWAGPIFNYGTNNYFEKMSGLTAGYNDSGVYDGTLGFYNWGTFTTCQSVVGSGGPMRVPASGCFQTYDGHDALSTLFGNVTHPMENYLGGMIAPDEFAETGAPVTFDSTELWYGKHSECSINADTDCQYESFSGFGSYLYIGPFERIPDAPMTLFANIKAKNSGNLTLNIQVYANNGSSNTACSISGEPVMVGNKTVTALTSEWSVAQIPVDFTGYAGCDLKVQYIDATSANVLETGFFNFVPTPDHILLPTATPTPGTSCTGVNEIIGSDATHIYACLSGTVVEFTGST